MRVSRLASTTFSNVRTASFARERFRVERNRLREPRPRLHSRVYSSRIMASADADEREIRAILSRALSYGAGEDMYKHWGECIIRPSGNPMSLKMFEEMMTGGDIVNKGGELLDVKIVDVGVDMAYACSVASAKFEYKGTPNDDVFVLTTIFKKDADGKWKICLAQRSTGRKPDEEPPGPWFTRD